ncbi:MAG: hypothetical protein EBZ77_17925, partial [Chitinophagia bacterium]|nr:hypothetical protein [Chitinophagia bacterium]
MFILLNTIHFYKAYEMKYAVRLGLLIGLAALTRPPDALSALIPLLWGLQRITMPAIVAQLQLLLRLYRQAIVAVLCAAVVVSVQFIYWKYVSGNWVVYSYQDQHIYFRSPNFFNYTFSYQSGWLLYTPTMILAFAGIPFYATKGKHAVAIIAFFLLNYYLVCAWKIWWFGGRAMVQSYPVLMFPLAMLLQEAFRKRWLAMVLAPFLAIGVYMNIWYTHQCHLGSMLPADSYITKAYYWDVAGRWHRDPGNIILLDETERYSGNGQFSQLYSNIFENDTVLPGNALAGTRSLVISDTVKQARELKFAAPKAPLQWLKGSALVRCSNTPNSVW